MKFRVMSLVLAASLASATSAAGLATMGTAQPAATPGGPVELTSSELAEGFKDRKACQSALAGGRDRAADARSDRAAIGSGSEFNRTRGHISRCERVDGEYLIVVYPGA